MALMIWMTHKMTQGVRSEEDEGHLDRINDEHIINDGHTKRKRRIVRSGVFVNPFDTEFEAMLLERTPDEGKQKKKAVPKARMKKVPQRNESDDRESSGLKKRQSKRGDEQEEQVIDGRSRGGKEIKRPRGRPKALARRNRNTSVEGTGVVDSNIGVQDSVSQVLHPSTKTVEWCMEEDAEDGSQTRTDENRKEGEIEISDEQLLRELEDVIFNA